MKYSLLLLLLFFPFSAHANETVKAKLTTHSQVLYLEEDDRCVVLTKQSFEVNCDVMPLVTLEDGTVLTKDEFAQHKLNLLTIGE